MERIVSSECVQKVGEKVLIKGWLHNLRDLGKIAFVVLRDRGGLIQVVVESKEELDKLSGLQEGSILHIKGEVKENTSTDLGIEIVNPEITVAVPIAEVAPIEYNKKSLDVNVDTELDYRPLVIRNLKKQAIFKVQSGIVDAFSRSMESQGFVGFRSPVLMGAPSESGADVFEVKYFEGKAYLAQSPQIYKQIMVGAFERVYTIATVFRAEKHNTTRHLMEITQLDGEMGFIESLEDVYETVEKVVRDIFSYLSENYSEELKLWNTELPKLPEGKFPRVTIKEALGIIEKRLGKDAKREELDLDPEDEREIGKWALEEHGSDFVWLLNFKKNKNFYTWNSEEDPETSKSYDLVCRGLEWLSGTHRIHIYEELYKRFKEQGLNEADYVHYLQAFKYGIPSEAGFSLGLERMTQQIFGLKNIREATLFPSDLKRIAGAKRRLHKVHGGDEMVSSVKALLDSRHIDYKFIEHEEVRTSEEAAEVRGTPVEEGAKAIIIKGKKTGENYMVVVPAHLRIDKNSVKEKIEEPFEFEEPEVILEKYGLEVGGIPPFGHFLGMRVLLDEEIFDRENVTFNCGKRTCSIDMRSEDLKDVVDAEIGEWSE